MKFFAVASMLLGFWSGSILSKKLKKRGLVFINMLVMGIVVRLVVMSLLNLILIFFLTGFFGFGCMNKPLSVYGNITFIVLYE